MDIITKSQLEHKFCVNENDICEKRLASSLNSEKPSATSLFSRKQSLGAQIHRKILFILINMYYPDILVVLISRILVA